MPYILMGSLAFLLFIIYDINSVTVDYRPLRGGFFLGCLLLIAATVEIISSSIANMGGLTGRTAGFSALACIFLILLVYTLFFAIPFKKTYIKPNQRPETCTTGIYALSRHPGVLWFVGFYFSLWLALSGSLLLTAAILFCLLNLFYIILQDRWVFMKIFADYGDYKKTTPFLIPNYRSLRRCVQTFHRTAWGGTS
ncbi:MAG TPA: methyltransferase [Anaerovoracaceae bacterium]|nr:methyltransferase [Anaerovoracaceae bacterium]